mgnify:CR=1 FL=1
MIFRKMQVFFQMRKFLTHSKFYSDAYRTAANIGLDYMWFGTDRGQYAAPLCQMRFLGTDLEAARGVFETDGMPLDRTVLPPRWGCWRLRHRGR